MNISKEINILKEELTILNQNLKKLTQYNEELRKIIQKQDQFIQKKKAQRKITYIDWLSNERRINNLIKEE